MTEERQIMAIDTEDPASILLSLGIGNKRVDIPRHILGYDDDWRNIFKKIKWFATLEAAEQKAEMKRWKSFKTWEKRIYERRIEILVRHKGVLCAKYAQGAAGMDTNTAARVSPLLEQVEDICQQEPTILSESRRTFFRGSNKRQREVSAPESQEAEESDDEAEVPNLKSVSLFSNEDDRKALQSRTLQNENGSTASAKCPEARLDD
jgi:hypothetical protein